MRVEELEECVLEKDQEIMRLQQISSRLQGEVYTCTHALPELRFKLHYYTYTFRAVGYIWEQNWRKCCCSTNCNNLKLRLKIVPYLYMIIPSKKLAHSCNVGVVVVTTF